MDGQAALTGIMSKDNEHHAGHYHREQTEKYIHPKGVIGHSQPQRRKDGWGILSKRDIYNIP